VPIKLAYVLGLCDFPELSGDSDGMWTPPSGDRSTDTVTPDGGDDDDDMEPAPWRRAGSYWGVEPVDVNRLVPKTIMVMTDFVRPSIVGSTLTNVIKVLPVPLDRKDSFDHGYVSQDFVNLEYFEVANSELNVLSFELLNVDETPVSYSDPGDEVNIRLHFRAVARDSE
jgi:hypothetical protein